MIEPGMPNITVEAGNEVVRHGDRLLVKPHLIMDAEYVEQLRLGWRCISCYQVQTEAMPEECGFVAKSIHGDYACKFPMREKQLGYFAEQFRGYTTRQPAPLDELLDDERDYWRKTKTGVIIPRGI